LLVATDRRAAARLCTQKLRGSQLSFRLGKLIPNFHTKAHQQISTAL